jgi:flavin reductase (DIM6/NTAB) family NADH-FMN oxidoreductase RutF
MPKIDVKPEWWDNIFAPSSCLTLITTIDKDGRVNAAAFGTCTRVCHEPMYIAFTCSADKDTTNNVLATGEFVVNVVPFEQAMLDKVPIAGCRSSQARTSWRGPDSPRWRRACCGRRVSRSAAPISNARWNGRGPGSTAS